MRRCLRFCKRADVVCTLWIAVCFSLTSVAYLCWVYRLMALADSRAVDAYTLVLGYVLQALGAGMGALLFRRRPELAGRRSFAVAATALCVVTLPAMRGSGLPGTLIFGLLMNFLCGVIACFYLCGATMRLEVPRRGTAFGCGYGASAVFVFLLSRLDQDNFLRTRGAFIACLILSALAVWLARVVLAGAPAPHQGDARTREPASGRTLLLAAATVLLLSAVKNMGFSFPSADLESGASLELSRLFYAAGLIVAGVIGDRSRKTSAVCTVAALALPFAMLAISDGSVPAMLCWGLNYLFYSFFSVFRAIVFMDLAAQEEKWHIAALGLTAGRLGDAAGSAICLVLADARLPLIALTLALFIATMFLFFALYQRLYMPEAVRERSEKEVFDTFAAQHDLSMREREVLRLILAEQSIVQIAEALFVSESTVRYHVHNLLQKTGCKSRQALVRQFHLTLHPDSTE